MQSEKSIHIKVECSFKEKSFSKGTKETIHKGAKREFEGKSNLRLSKRTLCKTPAYQKGKRKKTRRQLIGKTQQDQVIILNIQHVDAQIKTTL